MQIVQVFKTDDGQTFATRADARRHEIEVESLANLFAILKTSINTGRPESVIRHLLLENSAVSAVLAMYRKKQPIEANVITLKQENANVRKAA